MILDGSESEASSSSTSSSSSSIAQQKRKRKKANSDSEMPYEKLPRSHLARDDNEDKAIERLPIKLQNGIVQRSKEKVVPQAKSDSEEESDLEDEEFEATQPVVEDVSTGARFGRPAVIDIIKAPSRRGRIEAAKIQIAGICQDIIAEPENNVRQFNSLVHSQNSKRFI